MGKKKLKWKELPVKTWGFAPIPLKKHYKKGNTHAYIYGRNNKLELIRGTIKKNKFKKTSSKVVKDTFSNYQKLVRLFRK